MKTTPHLAVLTAAIGLAAIALPLASQAAPVTWGPPTNITATSDISSTGVTSLAGANFGITTGTTILVNNGSVDVEFKSLRSGENATLSNGITVAAAASWENWGYQDSVSNIGGTFETVLDSNLGDETNPLTSTITLSGLTEGTQYQIQFFADSTGNNGQTIDGGSTINSRNGQFVTGTFTADATSQVLTVTSTSGGFAVANALTIGTIGGGPDTTAPEWIATWPQADPLSSTSLTVRAKTNETGTAYYVVLADGATAPSAAQVKAGTDSSNAAATAAGSLAITANTEASGPVTGLTADTSYDVYFVAEDAVPNLQATPVLVNVSLVTPAGVTWGSWTPVSDETAIQTPGGYTYYGVNFNGSANTTTTINNGPGGTGGTDVTFTDLAPAIAVLQSAASPWQTLALPFRTRATIPT